MDNKRVSADTLTIEPTEGATSKAYWLYLNVDPTSLEGWRKSVEGSDEITEIAVKLGDEEKKFTVVDFLMKLGFGENNG